MLYRKMQVSESEGYRWDATPVASTVDMTKLRELKNVDTLAALEFLSLDPVHTVVMASFISDNGIESVLNRGKFFGYGSADGKLEGLALIGHATIIEARSDRSMEAFALAAEKSETPIKLVMSSDNNASRFWRSYTGGSRTPTQSFEEVLFEASFPFTVQKCNWDVRLATIDELDQVARAQADVAFLETGLDPMEVDREGFVSRVGNRIDKGRVYVAMKDGILVFKADVMAEANDVCYIEGVYVNENFRGKGVGPTCLSKVCIDLFDRVSHVSLLSNATFQNAHRSFERAGFKRKGTCLTLFV